MYSMSVTKETKFRIDWLIYTLSSQSILDGLQEELHMLLLYGFYLTKWQAALLGVYRENVKKISR